jgi:hypothetical protein
MKFSINAMLVFHAWFAVSVVLCKLTIDRYYSHPDSRMAPFDGWLIFYIHATGQWIGTVGGCMLAEYWENRAA